MDINQNKEADEGFAHMKGGLDLKSRASIRADYGRIQEVPSMVCESVPSSVADRLQLTYEASNS